MGLRRMSKYVFVTGGVLSSLGKGILSSSIARLLKSRGVKTACMKIDPYLNADAGTLNPFEHGEVFVTQDGFECDLDVGNYERFLDVHAKKEQNLMMGTVYSAVIEAERKGDYLGTTVQLIPHVTNELKKKIREVAKVTGCDLLVVEIGGTVGDIESDVVMEAARQMRFEEAERHGRNSRVAFVHLALVPTLSSGEQKTKPMQHSVKALLSRGIQPDFIVARCKSPLDETRRSKISIFCNVWKEDVFHSPDLENIYELPSVLEEQGMHEQLAKMLDIELSSSRGEAMKEWDSLIEEERKAKVVKKVAVIGKYASSKDAYMSVFESISHAGIACGVKAVGELIDSEALEKGKASLEGFDAFIVPGGFGGRGVEGKIQAIKLAREKNLPYLGICYGMQMAVIEVARDVLGFKDANTSEVDEKTKHAVIDILPEQKKVEKKGGTMRLGVQKTLIEKGTIAHDLYKSTEIMKRHRHRFEVNPEFIEQLEKKGGVKFSGKSEDGLKMEILEIPGHKYFTGCQYHPEFDSRLGKPEPLFYGLIKATL